MGLLFLKELILLALAGVAQWIDPRWSKVCQSGHMPGLQARPRVGVAQEATTH